MGKEWMRRLKFSKPEWIKKSDLFELPDYFDLLS